MTEESYPEIMNRIAKEAHIEAEKYSCQDDSLIIAGRFTLKEMMEFREFYRESGDLFVAPGPDLDPYDYYPDYHTNIREFFIFLLLRESDIPKFIFEKYRQINFAK